MRLKVCKHFLTSESGAIGSDDHWAHLESLRRSDVRTHPHTHETHCGRQTKDRGAFGVWFRVQSFKHYTFDYVQKTDCIRVVIETALVAEHRPNVLRHYGFHCPRELQ